MLEVHDSVETIAFYETLGFVCTDKVGPAAKPTWFQVVRDDVALMFSWSEPHDHEEGDDHVHGPGMNGAIYINVDDVDGLFAEVGPRLQSVVYEPKNFEHGMREFAVNDCNGYLIVFGQGIE